ncbi:MAG: tetratricopeptide repeat protein [Myxococcota bacterium]
MSYVRDVTEAQFETAVLARSREVPVVVDFWAEWCAPCRMLGPTLEREVNALGGRVELAKVDVDRAQALAGSFGVQGIPAVMAFRDGKKVDEFVGARDAGFVKRWLSGLAPSDASKRLANAKTEAELEALLGDAEVGGKAALRLAEKKLAAGKSADALALLEKVDPRSADAAAAEALRAQAAFAVDAAAFGGESKARAALAEKPDDLDARWALASALAARGDFPGALEEFLTVVKQSRKYRDDGARRAMVTLFDRLGNSSDVTREFRRRLQIAL